MTIFPLEWKSTRDITSYFTNTTRVEQWNHYWGRMSSSGVHSLKQMLKN